MQDHSTSHQPEFSKQLPISTLGVIPRSKNICDECQGVHAPDLLRVFRVKSGPIRRRRLCPECLDNAIVERLILPGTCRECGETKPADHFAIETRKEGHPHRVTLCDECRSFRARHRNYGVNRIEYERILNSQGGVCAICHTPPGPGMKGDRLYIDHDHDTGNVRGLLCSGCNTGLGQFEDNPNRLESAIRYLEHHKWA